MDKSLAFSESGRPVFSTIDPASIVPTVEAAIAAHEQAIAEITAQTAPDFDSVFLAKARADDALRRATSVISHLQTVIDTPALREAFQQVEPKLIAHGSAVGQNQKLFALMENLLTGPQELTPVQRRAVDLAVRGFRMAGVALPEDDRAKLGAVQVELANLSNQFANMVLDASFSWTRSISAEEAKGIPEAELEMLANNAVRRGGEGLLVTLDAASVMAVLSYADDRALRAEVYRALNTRASDQGPNAGQFDNSARMDQILAQRHEGARLLGYENYAGLSMALKMARDADEVLAFLTDLVARVRPGAQRELAELRTFAAGLGIDQLESWDVAYVSERLRRERYSVDLAEIRRYFQLSKVLDGLFGLFTTLFGVTLTEDPTADVWHPDVRFYTVNGSDGVPIAGVYLDLYARQGKRGGAWMDVCRARFKEAAGEQLPLAYLVCNFSAPAEGRPALLAHTEVTTLFHEFGHGLHHLLSEVELPSIAGISGFEWDAVELPSQFLESFGWETEILRSISAHVDTGEPLPDALIERMRAARSFQAGMAMLRQIELSLFDMRLHLHDGSEAGLPNRILGDVRSEVSVLIPPEWTRFPHAFIHIFAGSYAAGYYSYLWAERLSSDAFGRFLEEGITSSVVGADYRREILAVGATRPALDSFMAFRGRAPESEPLLRQRGIIVESSDSDTGAQEVLAAS